LAVLLSLLGVQDEEEAGEVVEGIFECPASLVLLHGQVILSVGLRPILVQLGHPTLQESGHDASSKKIVDAGREADIKETADRILHGLHPRDEVCVDDQIEHRSPVKEFLLDEFVL